MFDILCLSLFCLFVVEECVFDVLLVIVGIDIFVSIFVFVYGFEYGVFSFEE